MPPTIASKEQLCTSIRQLKRQKTLTAVREARQLLRDWMRHHPGDVSSQDAGEELAMMEDVLETIAAEKAAEPIAA